MTECILPWMGCVSLLHCPVKKKCRLYPCWRAHSIISLCSFLVRKEQVASNALESQDAEPVAHRSPVLSAQSVKRIWMKQVETFIRLCCTYSEELRHYFGRLLCVTCHVGNVWNIHTWSFAANHLLFVEYTNVCLFVCQRAAERFWKTVFFCVLLCKSVIVYLR